MNPAMQLACMLACVSGCSLNRQGTVCDGYAAEYNEHCSKFDLDHKARLPTNQAAVRISSCPTLLVSLMQQFY